MPPLQLFVVPELGGRPTGGTLYNQRLLAALTALGAPVRVSDSEGASDAIRSGEYDLVWVDSLYLDRVPKLREMLGGRGRLGLFLHYLPALVAFGSEVTRAELSRAECEALEAVDLALVTSEFMRKLILRLDWGERSLLCVEPGCELHAGGERLRNPASGVRALLLAHVVNGKGIEPFLGALASRLQAHDRFVLRIVGDLEAEPAYAARCKALVAGEPTLSRRVNFCGVLPAAAVLQELEASNLLLSASVMESYGMALAEGRSVGLPLLALDAGNVRAHVQLDAGGELVASAEELAEACVRLCRDPAEHARRGSAAESHLPASRTWQRAALEFLASLQLPGNVLESPDPALERA